MADSTGLEELTLQLRDGLWGLVDKGWVTQKNLAYIASMREYVAKLLIGAGVTASERDMAFVFAIAARLAEVQQGHHEPEPGTFSMLLYACCPAADVPQPG